MKVRALPTWRNPVGDGAKRTRGFDDGERRDSGIGGETLMVWEAKSIVKPAGKMISRLSD
jgi:hypothetical protein